MAVLYVLAKNYSVFVNRKKLMWESLYIGVDKRIALNTNGIRFISVKYLCITIHLPIPLYNILLKNILD